MVDRILVELSLVYIKHLGEQTLKKPDNSSLTKFSQSLLTPGYQNTIMETYSTGISKKIIMETNEIVAHINDWAINRINELDSAEETYDKLAIIDEFYEWFSMEDDDVEIASVNEITRKEFNDYLKRK